MSTPTRASTPHREPTGTPTQGAGQGGGVREGYMTGDQLINLLSPGQLQRVAALAAALAGRGDTPVPCGCGVPHPPVRHHMITSDPARWRRARVATLQRDSYRCQVPTPGEEGQGAGVCGAPASVCGHVLARVFGGCDRAGNLRAECKAHSDDEGARITNEQRALAAAVSMVRDLPDDSKIVSSVGVPQHDPAMHFPSLSQGGAAAQHTPGPTRAAVPERTPGPADDCWDVPWLAALREVPEDATWPRYMTLPHPRAVGSYGEELCETFVAVNRRQPRWWQRLAFARIGEHDAEGLLCWPEYLGTLSRQGGKSWALRALAVWRLRQAERWDEQLVLHTARDKSIVMEVARPAMAWAENHGMTVSRNNGREGISTGSSIETGSRWLLRAKDAVYGLSPGCALVDEGWDVPGRYVDEGVEPTLVEQISPQLGLWSTAHRRATGLMLDRRTLALQQLLDPVDVLLLEWSTPASLDRGDRTGWRMASPFWSAARERLVERAYRKVMAGESVDPEEPDPVASFDAQWLNRWPGVATLRNDELEEDLVAKEDLRACILDAEPDPSRPLFTGVEDNLGRGAAAAAAALTRDGRVVVGGWEFDTRREAFDWAQDYAEAVDDSTVLVGASLEDDTELEGIDVQVELAGGRETQAGLKLLRELIRARTLAIGSDQLDVVRVLGAARVKPGVGSAAMLLVGHDRSDLLRTVAWTVERAHRARD